MENINPKIPYLKSGFLMGLLVFPKYAKNFPPRGESSKISGNHNLNFAEKGRTRLVREGEGWRLGMGREGWKKKGGKGDWSW